MNIYTGMLTRGGGFRATAPRLLKASKLALGSVSQALEHNPHLSQLGLEFRAGLIGGPAIQFHVDLTLDVGCFVGGILR